MEKTVLICDDNAFMRMILKDILKKNGFGCAGEAADGKQALEMYEVNKPSAVLMDITMPVMDGIEALKRIMAMDKNANVIMCSAMGQQQMVIESLESGARDFIVKPFQADRVVEAINKALS